MLWKQILERKVLAMFYATFEMSSPYGWTEKQVSNETREGLEKEITLTLDGQRIREGSLKISEA